MCQIKYRKIKLLLSVMTCAFTFTTHAAAISDDTYQQEFIEHLDLGPATYLKINAHGKTAGDIDKSLTQIYYDNRLQPFWIKEGKPDRRALDIIAALDDAPSHGLNPDDYFTDMIHQYQDRRDATGLVRLDILLTLGMLRYVADQQEGRIEPREVNPTLFSAARDAEVDWNVVRAEAFGTPDMKAFLEAQAPPFSQYRGLKKQLAAYRAIAADGGWPAVIPGEVLKPGVENDRIQQVRERLVVTGDLERGFVDGTVFDPALEAAVKRFQKRHNLTQDGIIGRKTLGAMNVPVSSRIDQIILSMERFRWLKRSLIDDRLVVVNIAGFVAGAYKAGEREFQMPVIVGKTYHETPVFSDTIKYVVFNPYWNLTASIARNETLPKLKQDVHYLKKHNMRIFDGWGPEARELDPTTIDWRNVSKKEMGRYRVRQDPGPDNALGTLKIVFPNKYSVYLHDTPTHGLFKQEHRAFSHGCIRMDRPAEMAAWVLGGEEEGWSIERVREIVATRERKVTLLSRPMPVYILYHTASMDTKENMLYFYEDIYGRDQLLAKALFGPDGKR